ncbi:class I SAM-dependent methyltransferase [Lacticaseibacillus kribbianus]|uniref:class I SAM-dependent methyltransferase n=1 Tax=Lacticaseibacillus kribbianus TaxID=2926292 RepID=UPI001CD6D5F4|nr:class I SAM-dependent methyltransferase [Lacticaseibacillus kribbianus]
MSNIEQYHQYVYDTPWGAMFYRLLWEQLDSQVPDGARVLDFGSGFGHTAKHLAARAQVTAYEPDARMLALAEGGFTQASGDWQAALGDPRFDWILLHNVLEYVPDPTALVGALGAHLAPGGHFSIVRHNRLGHVYAAAVLSDDPAQALATYEQAPLASQSFGDMNLYDNDQLNAWLAPTQRITTVWGLRTVFGLSANSGVKATAAWQAQMAALERKLAVDPIARETAFFQHVVTSAQA